jgi:ribonucleoside-diphosphate reductase alpha chain
MMGCDTTGVEPAFSLVSHNSLAGGGSMTIVNGVVERALYHLGYDDTVVRKINAELADGGSDIRRFIRPEHAPVFQAAVGEDAIDSMGHVKMVAAIQPHLSQAVSKTVNMPSDCTVEDVERVYVEAWRMGLKGISIYRDGSKATQVLRSEPKPDALQIGVIAEMMDTAASAKFPDGWVLEVLPPNQAHESVRLAVERVPQPHRRHMPRERQATVVKFVIDGHKGYLTIGLHEDGTVGEIFLNGIGKDGSTLRGMADAWATDFSIGLQHGVPLETLVRKHAHVRFPPEGATGDPDVPTATSIPDFVVRKIAALYLDADTCEELGVLSAEIKRRMTERLDMQAPGGLKFALESVGEATIAMPVTHDVGASCRQCGGMLQRTGSCWICQTCFASTGCG